MTERVALATISRQTAAANELMAIGMLAAALSTALRGISGATGAVGTQMRFNMQYLRLQSQMQLENRSYTAISNIMKAKHDTVKNSIGNIK
jgi:hypothetical protein